MDCDRCGKKNLLVFTMSRFNTEHICMDCEGKEKDHPGYKEAFDAERAAVRAGDMNFPSIGLPADLRAPR